MKLEQASKVETRAPTRRITGEGLSGRARIDMCARPVRRGSEHGTLEMVVRVIGGDPFGRAASLNVIVRMAARRGVGQGRSSDEAG